MRDEHCHVKLFQIHHVLKSFISKDLLRHLSCNHKGLKRVSSCILKNINDGENIAYPCT